MSKPKVELIVAESHMLKAENSIFVTIGPEWADWCNDIATAVKDLVGHDRVLVAPFPNDAMKFYQIEHDKVVAQVRDMPPVELP